METKIEKLQNKGVKVRTKEPEQDQDSTYESTVALSMIKSISYMLEEIMEETEANKANMDKHIKNYKKYNKDHKYKGKIVGECFMANKPPGVDIYSYLERILKYTHIEDSSLILSLVYIDRLCELNDIQLNKFNIHRIVMASVLLSVKFNEDDFYSNTNYAKVGGISLKEMNALENEFLSLIQYNVFVSEDIYEKYKHYLTNY